MKTVSATMWTTVWARTMNAACATDQGQTFPSSMKSCTPRIRYSLIRLMSGTCLNMRRIRLFTFVCPVSGCTDETAGNYSPEAVIEDGSCVYGPLECGGVSTVTYDGYTYDLVAIGDQCWFAENLAH